MNREIKFRTFDKEKIDLDRLEYFIGGQLVSIGEYMAYKTRGI